jgi:hypothetical protein
MSRSISRKASGLVGLLADGGMGFIDVSMVTGAARRHKATGATACSP